MLPELSGFLDREANIFQGPFNREIWVFLILYISKLMVE